MSVQIVKDQASRWQVIVPWTRGKMMADVVAVELTTQGNDITVKMIGSKQPITFPLERAKLFLDALRDAVAFCEANHVSSAG